MDLILSVRANIVNFNLKEDWSMDVKHIWWVVTMHHHFNTVKMK